MVTSGPWSVGAVGGSGSILERIAGLSSRFSDSPAITAPGRQPLNYGAPGQQVQRVASRLAGLVERARGVAGCRSPDTLEVDCSLLQESYHGP
jgi:hypothetical protein